MSDTAAVVVATLGSLVGTLVGGGIVLRSTRSANEAAKQLAAADHAARYQDERRERLRAAYGAMLVLARAYSDVLHGQQFVMSNESEFSRDARLFEALDKALAAFRPHELDLVLDKEARDLYIQLCVLQQEYLRVQITKGSGVTGATALATVGEGTQRVSDMLLSLETECREHLDAMAPHTPV